MVPYQKYKRNSLGVFSTINITPFTDVVLVLLIVFMIAAPGLVQTGLSINLPQSSTARSEIPKSTTVALDGEGLLYLDGASISRADLEAKIVSWIGENSQLSVILNADEGTEHGRVIEILDTLRKSGAKNIYVGTFKK